MTRATPKLAAQVPSTPGALRKVVTSQGGSGVKAEAVVSRPVRPDLPRPVYRMVAPQARAPGDEALGTGSLAKSARWKALGGHGRNGVG